MSSTTTLSILFNVVHSILKHHSISARFNFCGARNSREPHYLVNSNSPCTTICDSQLQSTFSIEQLQQLHSCLLSEAGALAALQLNPVEDLTRLDWMRPSMAHLQVSTPRPTYKDIASAGEPSNGFSSFWKGESITGCTRSVLPRVSVADVGRWLENFVGLQGSLDSLWNKHFSHAEDLR